MSAPSSDAAADVSAPIEAPVALTAPEAHAVPDEVESTDVPERSSSPSLADATPLAAVVTALVAAADAPSTAPLRRRRRRPATEPAADAPTIDSEPTAAPMLDTVLVAAEPFELLEPVIDEAPTATEDEVVEPASTEPAVDAQDAASALPEEHIDAFEAAARLFSFTAETPIQSAPEPENAAGAEQPTTEHVATRRSRGAAFKRVSAASFSVGVMGIVGLLTVGLTTPADAVAAANGTDITSAAVASANGDVAPGSDEIQAYVTPAEMQSAAIDRNETYSTLTMAQLASESGISNYSNFFINNPNSPIQWPFAVGVPISYGFGMRDGTMHEGVDFTPGEGSPIQAIADGVVRESTDSGGAFGVHIVIDHIIDGVLVSSSYSHMLYGSRQVEVGDHVTVGTIVGHTGNTGRSYGAHTHFEILQNGTTPIDPIPWLREHAGG
ncbi:M23 family metallopeptidase [Microbacterium sp. cf046]|uniref:M23 family metallopeptidase n=1 Tax=Microbacterium sp. cf046 TaxID=1761803 RepID=UPI0020C86F20|nr:peptidoglycan DD-metalloendopeptidase family protein [Microbacterium sp. cf046]